MNKMIITELDDNGHSKGIKGFHGVVGTPTNMTDSFGEKLYIGDIVLPYCVLDDGIMDYPYGNFTLYYVCEENINIANWTNKNNQFVNGIRSIWNNVVFDFIKINPKRIKTIIMDDSIISDVYKDENTLRLNHLVVKKVIDHSVIPLHFTFNNMYTDIVKMNDC